jgi:hypothetical protein
MNKKCVKIGWTLYFEDKNENFSNYLDYEGYNMDGFKWNGKQWVDRDGNSATRYFKKDDSDEEYISYVLDNEVYFQWTILLSKIENF